VALTSRDATKGQKAVEEVNDYLKNNFDEEARGRVMVANLDLCDLDNVKSFKSRLENMIGTDRKVDVLMNNAGVMAIPDRRLTNDGYEMVKCYRRNVYTPHSCYSILTDSYCQFSYRHSKLITW
jgi:NADP-dependent 3-hydroxy acid dehydrogenase YdfG